MKIIVLKKINTKTEYKNRQTNNLKKNNKVQTKVKKKMQRETHYHELPIKILFFSFVPIEFWVKELVSF